MYTFKFFKRVKRSNAILKFESSSGQNSVGVQVNQRGQTTAIPNVSQVSTQTSKVNSTVTQTSQHVSEQDNQRGHRPDIPAMKQASTQSSGINSTVTQTSQQNNVGVQVDQSGPTPATVPQAPTQSSRINFAMPQTQSLAMLRRNLQVRRRKQRARQLKCKHCEKIYLSESGLQRHMKDKHQGAGVKIKSFQMVGHIVDLS